MKERLAEIAIATTAIAAVSVRALSLDQRRAIRERDGHRCQFPHPPGDACTGRCAIHHIKPQKWLKDHGVPEAVRDQPTNLLYICEHAHQQIHPNNQPRSGDQLYDRWPLGQLIRERKPFWVTAFDGKLDSIARTRTRQAVQRGWVYPEKPAPVQQSGHDAAPPDTQQAQDVAEHSSRSLAECARRAPQAPGPELATYSPLQARRSGAPSGQRSRRVQRPYR